MRSKNFLRRKSIAIEALVQPEKSSRSVIEIIPIWTGFSVVLLYLYGYGVAVGVAEKLGVDHSLLIGSPFDLFVFSGYGVPVLVEGIFVLLSAIELHAFRLAAGVLLVVLFSVILVFCYDKYFSWRLRKQVKKFEGKNFLKTTLGRVLGYFVAIPSAAGFGVVFVVSAAKVIVASLLVFVLAPLWVGYANGGVYAEKYIINPERCFVKLSNDGANLFKISGGALCINVRSIENGKIAEIKGRLVVSANDFVVLFDKSDGSVKKISKTEFLIQQATP